MIYRTAEPEGNGYGFGALEGAVEQRIAYPGSLNRSDQHWCSKYLDPDNGLKDMNFIKLNHFKSLNHLREFLLLINSNIIQKVIRNSALTSGTHTSGTRLLKSFDPF